VKRRDANRILVGLAALGGGIVGYSFPLDLLDRVVAATGAAAAVPTLGPPLGVTARFVLVGLCAAITVALTAAVLPWKKGRAGDRDRPEPFFSALENSDDAIPVLRRSDAHPDAPARPPLFASRDLGHEALPPVEDRPDDMSSMFDRIWPEQGMREADDHPPPPALEPMPWEMIQAEMDRLLAGVRFRPIDEAVSPMPPGEQPEPEMPEQPQRSEEDGATGRIPSIQELIARLELGLARRRTAAAPVSDSTAVTGVTVRAG